MLKYFYILCVLLKIYLQEMSALKLIVGDYFSMDQLGSMEFQFFRLSQGQSLLRSHPRRGKEVDEKISLKIHGLRPLQAIF